MKMHKTSLLLLFAFAVAMVDSAGVEKSVASSSRRTLQVVKDTTTTYSSLLNSVLSKSRSPFDVGAPISMSKPCCVSWGPGRVDCFIRNQFSYIMHWSEQGDTVNGWKVLDRRFIKDVECVSRQKESIDILAIEHDGVLRVNSYEGATGRWTGWKDPGEKLMEAPSCAAQSSSVECVGRDFSNKLVWLRYNDGKWISQHITEKQTRYPCKTDIRPGSTSIEVYYVGSDSHLWGITYDDKEWSPGEDLKGTLRGPPEVVSTSMDRIDVLGVSPRNELVHRARFPTKGWRSWEYLGRTILGDPSCVALDKSIHCFMVLSDTTFNRRTLKDGKWSKWFRYRGSFIEGPSCVASQPVAKTVSCYLRGTDLRITQMSINVKED